MNIYDFIFHYNPYRKLWAAVHREAYTDYWNGIYDAEKVFFAGDKSTLLLLFNDAPKN